MNISDVRDVRFAGKTSFTEGLLTIDKQELKALILEDPRLRQVEIELTRPGEKRRILKVLDVFEPRAKTSEGHEDFPGAVGRLTPAGQGETRVLRGAAVVISDYREKREISTSSDPNGEIIDMAGPGAEAGQYGQTCNAVLLAAPEDRVATPDYFTALKLAGLKTAAYLARAAKDAPPDEVETFEFPALSSGTPGADDLPKIVYIFQIQTLQFAPIQGEPVLYGRNVPDLVPTLIHPNEVLDGALTSPFPTLNMQTYQIQNHPIIRELFRRNGRELRFVGVILTIAPNNVRDIDRVSMMAADLAKHVVGADGALLTKIGGGAPELTLAKTARCCEQLGIRTVLAMLHMGADIKDAKYGATTIFSLPEVDTIVSMGMPFTELTLPAVETFIGRPGQTAEGPPIEAEHVRAIRWIKGAQCQLGGSKLRAIRV